MDHRVIAINDYKVDGVIIFKGGESYLINEVLIHKNRSRWIASKRISNELIYLNKCFYIDEKNWDNFIHRLRIIGEDSNIWYMSTNNFKAIPRNLLNSGSLSDVRSSAMLTETDTDALLSWLVKPNFSSSGNF